MKSIKAKILLMILPLVVCAIIAVSVISAIVSNRAISMQTHHTAGQTLKSEVNLMDGKLEAIRNTAENIAEMVSATYQKTSMDEYGASLTRIIKNNDMVLGSGLWFEKKFIREMNTWVPIGTVREIKSLRRWITAMQSMIIFLRSTTKTQRLRSR